MAQRPATRNQPGRCAVVMIHERFPSPILVERHAEYEAMAGGDRRHAVFDRLQAVDAADAQEPVTGAEEHYVAEPRRDLPTAGLLACRHVAEEKLTAVEAVRLRVCRVGAGAENDGHLEGEEDGATQVAVQGVEAARNVLQENRRRRGLSGAAALIP